MKDWINKIICGDSLTVLKTMPDNFVDCVMTSPPYWGLRDYGSAPQIWDGDKNCEHNFTKYNAKLQHENRQNLDGGTIGNPDYREKLHGTGNSPAGFCTKCGAWRGELGLEPDFNLYIEHLCDIFDEVKRVLKDTGTIWINLGDTYGGSGCGTNDYRTEASKSIQGIGKNIHLYKTGGIAQKIDYPAKSLCCIPDRFRIEMINRGWILRNKIEWFKRNCMPSSANDRFTIDFEDICFFAKSNKVQYWTNEKTFELVSNQPLGTKGIENKDWEWREINGKKKKVSLWSGHNYYFEQQFEEYSPESLEDFEARKKRGMLRWGTGEKSKYWGQKGYDGDKSDRTRDQFYTGHGRNKRCVWEITTQPFPEAHFAVYPEELCVTPIKAGCPEFICKKCGQPREPILEPTEEYKKYLKSGSWTRDTDENKSLRNHIGFQAHTKKYSVTADYKRTGYADCSCAAEFNPGIVLDPFSGAGTTCLTARKLGRRYIGIEIKSEYKEMSERRIHNEAGLL